MFVDSRWIYRNSSAETPSSMCVAHGIPYSLWKSAKWNLLKAAVKMSFLFIQYCPSKLAHRNRMNASWAVGCKYIHTHTHIHHKHTNSCLFMQFVAVIHTSLYFTSLPIVIPVQVSLTNTYAAHYKCAWGSVGVCM